MERYNPQEIEKKWQKKWEEQQVYKTEADPERPKYYALEMFPYPSGNLHMGHVRNYSIGDVMARYETMEGCRCQRRGQMRLLPAASNVSWISCAGGSPRRLMP